ncbi:MAG: TerB family tellurite resistance protein [Rhodospirillales bacterium]
MSFFERLRAHHDKNKVRAQGFSFMKAAMAACAMVAVADGDTCKKESRRVKELLSTLEKLKIYNLDEAFDIFSSFAKKLEKDLERGRQDALKAIKAGAEDDPELARLIIMLCRTVSEADGQVDDGEKESIERIAAILDLADAHRVSAMTRGNSI